MTRKTKTREIGQSSPLTEWQPDPWTLLFGGLAVAAYALVAGAMQPPTGPVVHGMRLGMFWTGFFLALMAALVDVVIRGYSWLREVVADA